MKREAMMERVRSASLGNMIRGWRKIYGFPIFSSKRININMLGEVRTKMAMEYTSLEKKGKLVCFTHFY